jgi:hypothetical protein
MSGALNAVSEACGYTRLTASGLAVSGIGKLLGIFVAAATATPTITVYDNTAGSGTQITGAFTPVAGTFYPIPAQFRAGCYVVLSGTVDCTVLASPD